MSEARTPRRTRRPRVGLEADVNETVRQLMVRTGQTPGVLAGVLGVSRQAVAGRLAGRSQWHINDLRPVADHYGLTVCELISGYVAIAQADRLPPRAGEDGQTRI